MGIMFSVNQYNAVKTYCERIVKRAKANLRRKKKIASGALYESIKYKINRQTETFYFEYDAYGQFVESGRKPYPNRIYGRGRGGGSGKSKFIENLEKWAKLKGIKASPFAIANSINKKGIKAVPFITHEIDKSEDELVALLEEAIEKDF
jgi:hypothetical protein